MARRFDLAGLQQFLERLLVVILEPARLEVRLLGIDDMLRRVEHILGERDKLSDPTNCRAPNLRATHSQTALDASSVEGSVARIRTYGF